VLWDFALASVLPSRSCSQNNSYRYEWAVREKP